jgi:hypothetical protein
LTGPQGAIGPGCAGPAAARLSRGWPPDAFAVCPGVEAALADRLRAELLAEPWLVHALDMVAASRLPDAWIGAGVIRDVVWGRRHGGFDPRQVSDIDVAFFDPTDLTPERDRAAQDMLIRQARLPWEATNQAAVHTWFADYFGGEQVAPLASIHDAVGTWPETATCVAVRLGADGLQVCAPHGLADLLEGVWRRNRRRVGIDRSNARLARHRERWPDLRVVC